jgi:pyruvate formate lyase activating enzyme
MMTEIQNGNQSDREAMYYDTPADSVVQCRLCPLECRLPSGAAGVCRSRKNKGNRMILTTYGSVSVMHLDPMEKKPLYHFLPGKPVLSLGNNGCNLKCAFCQNWQLSQTPLTAQNMTPKDIVKQANACRAPAVAFTYAEPLVWYEFVLDTCRLLKENGIKTVLVSNGFINEAPFLELRSVVDALNIDIKSMDDSFYRRLCKGSLKPVLKTCVLAAETCHVEITNLIIPGENDSDDNFHRLASFIRDNLGENTPLHLSRYYPAYQMNVPATPEKTVMHASAIARQYLNFVYVGNLPTVSANSTYCPKCRHCLIDRSGYGVNLISVSPGGTCPSCGFQTGIVLQ